MPDVTRKFESKKLLLLGTNAGTCDMVNYARSQGAYVIVTDNLPPEKSAAKQIADEAWSVNTMDIDTLEQLALQNKVNGISAGASDFNAERALSLCVRLGLPFYCNRRQWEICSNKQRFKQLCRDNGVPVAKEYLISSDHNTEDLQQIQYPVIVKPVDLGGGTGIGICRNEEELLRAHHQALYRSRAKQAIVEEFVEGDEFSAGYTIQDGQFSLTYVADRYTNAEVSETIPLPQAFILPSKYTNKYLEELNSAVIRMFQSIGLFNGSIFLQGIINNNHFHILEANYRLGGFSFYRFISRINGINYMEMLVNHALTGKMEGYDLSLDNPKLNKCGCYLPLLSRGGVVGKVIGIEKISKKKSLIAVDNLYDIGDYIEKSGTLRQIHLQFFLVEDTIQEVKDSILEIQDTVKVLDDQGQDMLLPPFNPERL
jgi:biotin carboxylase